MIEIIGTELNQWDTGRSVKVSEATHVHFANQGDSKAVIMELVDSQALIPNYLLQTGKQLCVYAVANGVTIERKMFSVKKRERPENYVYDDDQRNYIYELITSAEKAVADANEAAERATQAASSWAMIGDASGESVAIYDAVEQPFIGFRIFGKTTQDGTPTPDAPVELVSVGDSGSITVNVAGANEANSMTVATPNGLPGIPVTSGGNYTDADGQQWICDEIDFARGVYVQRIGKADLGTLSWRLYKDSIFFSTGRTFPSGGGKNVDTNLLCSIYAPDKTAQDWQYVSSNCVLLRKDTDVLDFYSVCVKDMRFNAISDFQNAVLGINLYYILPVLVETPLPEEQLAAYAALHTYRKNTTVSNDASAYMEMEYSLDAKKYLDNLVITGGGSAARLATVSLPASKWTGADSLYSQVVTIAGTTPNSKVDLLPSVEQLAIFHNKDVTFVTENENGVVTVYAIGDKPLLDYTMQAQITEVVV